MKKILIIGVKGMAGHVIYQYFSSFKQYDVYGIARNVKSSPKIYNVDVFNIEEVRTLIAYNNFAVIVNCIGILNKDAEENPAKAIWFNSYFPHFLEEVTRNTNTKIVHISTDCVFLGRKGNYTENDFKDGEGYYAESKALGEITNTKDVTIRTSIIGPEINLNGIGLLHWFLKQPLSSKLNGFSNVFWTGLTTYELAKVINSIVEQNITGLIQVIPQNKINKYELLKLFNSIYRNNSLEIVKDDKYKIDKSLITIRGDFDYIVPTYEQMLLEQKVWISNHQDLYKHYFFNF